MGALKKEVTGICATLNNHLLEHSKNKALACLKTTQEGHLSILMPRSGLPLCSAGVVGCDPNNHFFSTEDMQDEGLSFLGFQEFIICCEPCIWQGFLPHLGLITTIVSSVLPEYSPFLTVYISCYHKNMGYKLPRNSVAGRNHYLLLIAWVSRRSP